MRSFAILSMASLSEAASARPPNVVATSDVPSSTWSDWGPGFKAPPGVDISKFQPQLRPLSNPAPSGQLGLRYVELPHVR